MPYHEQEKQQNTKYKSEEIASIEGTEVGRYLVEFFFDCFIKLIDQLKNKLSCVRSTTLQNEKSTNKNDHVAN